MLFDYSLTQHPSLCHLLPELQSSFTKDFGLSVQSSPFQDLHSRTPKWNTYLDPWIFPNLNSALNHLKVNIDKTELMICPLPSHHQCLLSKWHNYIVAWGRNLKNYILNLINSSQQKHLKSILIPHQNPLNPSRFSISTVTTLTQASILPRLDYHSTY